MTIEEYLGKDNVLGKDIWHKKYQFNNETFDQWLDRVSNNCNELRQLIADRKFLFGGRTLTNYNTNRNASTSNCYSIGYAPDSVEGIMEVAKQMALTYKSQGGQGVSMSKVRPKGTRINSSGYESDGIIPFMEIFNTTTASISQGGSRKGALMISLDAWHKEAESFITIKSETGKIEKANLSLEIDDEFMECVKEYYEMNVVKTVHRHFVCDSGEIVYDVTPITVYKKMCETAYNWGEPGVIYTNQFRHHNIMQYDDDYEIVTGNPCGEQPLPPHCACNLGSINLSEFVIDPYKKEESFFDMESFLRAVPVAIRGLDEVIDYGSKYHALPKQRKMAENYRNIGLGVMGLSSMFVKLGITYGSEQSKDLVNTIMFYMFRMAVMTSNALAKEKGVYPKYKDAVFQSDIIQDHFNKDEITMLKRYGLRNCSLLSVAPNGSIGTMLNVSTGSEPFYRISYQRTTQSLHKEQDVTYDVTIPEVKEYQKINHTNDIPSYFVGADQIAWKDRVEMQATLQKHVDAAISSTVNLPSDITLNEVEKLYLFGWEQKLKGITIFRSNCERPGILTTTQDNKENAANEAKSKPESKENTTDNKELKRGEIAKTRDNLIGKKRKLITGCGSLHFMAWFDPETGEVQETFCERGSKGGCASSYDSISRLASVAARAGAKTENIIDQLMSVNPCSSYTSRNVKLHDTSKGSSCSSAIAFALQDMYQEIQKEIANKKSVPSKEKHETINNPDTLIKNDPSRCPECGDSLVIEGGCNVCKSCGWSKCE
jgi:ribonucleoside-diphosphate reductase alpha chain